MAIIEGIQGLEVAVKVNGQTAAEYDDPEARDEETDEANEDKFHVLDPDLPRPHVVKYIEAKPGASFSFAMNRNKTFTHIGHNIFFWAKVDGRRNGVIMNDEKSDERGDWKGEITSFWFRDSGGQENQHLLKFGSLDIREWSPITALVDPKQSPQARHS